MPKPRNLGFEHIIRVVAEQDLRQTLLDLKVHPDDIEEAEYLVLDRLEKRAKKIGYILLFLEAPVAAGLGATLEIAGEKIASGNIGTIYDLAAGVGAEVLTLAGLYISGMRKMVQSEEMSEAKAHAARNLISKQATLN